MAIDKLLILEQRLSTVNERRRRLGGFDANAEDLLVICDSLLAVIEHLIEMERSNAKTRKK